MEDTAALHELQCQQHLLRVGPHCLDVEAHLLPILAEHLTQVHAEEGGGVGVGVGQPQLTVLQTACCDLPSPYTHLRDSNTRQRWFLWEKWVNSRTQ